MRGYCSSSIVLCILFAVNLVQIANAYEIDNFKNRDRFLKDSLVPLDYEMNLRLNEAAKKTSAASGCNSSKLYDAINKKIGGNPIGSFEQYAENSDLLDRLPGSWSPGSDPIGIYNGISIWTSLGVGLTGTASVISAHGIRIGSDKFGHFASQGKDYFDAFADTHSIEEAYKVGWDQENGLYGLWGSGILSYGDLSANYAGLIFWLNVLHGPDPYFACQNSEYVLIRKFTWADYIHYGWDETINCSVFTPEVQEIVDQNKKEMGYRCPISKTACQEISKYNCAKFFLSPSCYAHVTESKMSCNLDKMLEKPYFPTDLQTSAIIEAETLQTLEENARYLKFKKMSNSMRAITLPIRQ